MALRTPAQYVESLRDGREILTILREFDATQARAFAARCARLGG